MNRLCKHSSAMCGHDPECPDLLCPGRPVTLHRVPGFHTDDGGKSVRRGFGVSLSAPLEDRTDPGENDPFFRASQVSGYTAFAIAAAFVFFLAILATVLIVKYAPGIN